MQVAVYNLCDMFLWFFFPSYCQGNVDASKVNQVGPEYHYHYAQRKMVDFIRKRYQILEKALNLEYAVVLSFSLCPHPSSQLNEYLSSFAYANFT